MKIKFTKNNSEVNEPELAFINAKHTSIERFAIYGILGLIGPWLYFIFPNIFPENESLALLLGKIILVLIACPILNVLLKIIANPFNIFREDTIICINLNGLSSSVNVFFMRHLNKFEAVFIAALPFLLLTVLPFIFLFSGQKIDVTIGLLAALNFGWSLPSLVQAIAYSLGISKKQQLQV